MVWKLLPQLVTSLECYYFITLVRSCVMGATLMNKGHMPKVKLKTNEQSEL